MSHILTVWTRVTVARISVSTGLWEIDITYSLNQDNQARMSASNGLRRIEVTYYLSQNNHSENVNVELPVKNRNRVHTVPGQPLRECQRPMAYEKSKSRTYCAKTAVARISASIRFSEIGFTYCLSQDRMSASYSLWEIKITYPLCQESHGEKVSIQWVVRIVLTYFLSQGNHGENVSVQLPVKSWHHVLPKRGRPWWECQGQIACENSMSRTAWTRKIVEKTSASHGLCKIDNTYILHQDNRGENVSVQWFVTIR